MLDRNYQEKLDYIFRAYKKLATQGELKVTKSLEDSHLEPFDIFITNLKNRYPNIAQTLFDKNVTKSIRITNKANLLITSNNESMEDLIRNHAGYPKIVEIINNLKSLASRIHDAEFQRVYMIFDKFDIEGFFVYWTDPCNIFTGKEETNPNWISNCEASSLIFELEYQSNSKSVLAALALIDDEVEGLRTLIADCKCIPCSYTIGDQIKDMDFIFSCEELKVLLEKQKFLVKTNLDEIMKKYHNILTYILAIVNLTNEPK